MSGACNRRRHTARRLGHVEFLEGRSLLSMMPITHHAAVTVRPVEVRILSAGTSAGTVRKAHNFYEFYVGPRRADLNVVSGSGQITRNGMLTLVGTMQGRIDTHPASSADDSYFVWGINRGSPQ